MIGPPLKPALCCMMVLSVVAAPTSFTLNAQSPSAAGTQSDQTAKLLRAMDQLVEQNRRLQEQNQQLMDEIGALRKLVAAQSASNRRSTWSQSGYACGWGGVQPRDAAQ